VATGCPTNAQSGAAYCRLCVKWVMPRTGLLYQRCMSLHQVQLDSKRSTVVVVCVCASPAHTHKDSASSTVCLGSTWGTTTGVHRPHLQRTLPQAQLQCSSLQIEMYFIRRSAQ
jgi:hypothetical protein